MAALPRFKSPALADSARVVTRLPGTEGRTLGPAFEASYVRARLLGKRTLIRVTCTIAVLLAVIRGAEQAVLGFWHPAQPFALALVLAGSMALALIAWTQTFERFYLALAQLLVPARNAVGSLFIAGAAARGQLEMLMFLPLMILAPYFFLGLSCRTALVSGLACFVSFGVSAFYFELAIPAALRVSALLIVAMVACTIAARHVEKQSRKSFLERHRIAELAEHDALTGLKNRRVFDEQLKRLWQQAVEARRSIAVLLVDVDHFKPFNDRYGHQAGDHALQQVAQALQSFVSRPLDVLARYGGEEFGVILYDIDARHAEWLAERMRRAVGGLALEHSGSRAPVTLTISVGVAFVEPSRDRHADGALQLADQALYEAKVRGRNRVALMDQTAHWLLETGVFEKTEIAARS